MVKNNKAQIESIDLFFSVIVIVIMVGITVVSFNNELTKMNRQSQAYGLEVKALEIAEVLIMQSGNPENWHLQADYNTPSLVNEKRIIYLEKWNAFTDSNYETLKQKMNIEEYQFELKLEQNGIELLKFAPISDTQAIQKISIQRTVEYNGEIAQFTFTLFQ
ncbi:MAG: hypothetical protein Q7S92_02170 [Candidatus Diapherotrites archaeon]|nr:hypothetical protein [Candidatus Diapherotrites archaeon]